MVETWVLNLGWEDPLKKGVATHSSILAWIIPIDRGAWWAAVYGVIQSQTRLSDLAVAAEMFLPGESQGRGSLVGCDLWGRTESDMTEPT